MKIIYPNEARIGNLFHALDVSGRIHLPINYPLVVTSIMRDCATFRGIHEKEHQMQTQGILMWQEIVPINLSEEWLLMLGFEKSGIYYFLKNIYVYLWGITEPSFHNQNIRHQDDHRYLHLEFIYVHQLQNYYFANYNEELTINYKL